MVSNSSPPTLLFFFSMALEVQSSTDRLQNFWAMPIKAGSLLKWLGNFLHPVPCSDCEDLDMETRCRAQLKFRLQHIAPEKCLRYENAYSSETDSKNNQVGRTGTLERGWGESTGKVRCLKPRLTLVAVIQISMCTELWLCLCAGLISFYLSQL